MPSPKPSCDVQWCVGWLVCVAEWAHARQGWWLALLDWWLLAVWLGAIGYWCVCGCGFVQLCECFCKVCEYVSVWVCVVWWVVVHCCCVVWVGEFHKHKQVQVTSLNISGWAHKLCYDMCYCCCVCGC